MFFSFVWLICVFLLVLATFFLYFYNKKQQFFVPFSFFRVPYVFWWYAVLFLLWCCVLLLPLHLSFVKDSHIDVYKQIPVQIVFDVSLSMAATDIVPSRFSAAKQTLISLVKSLDWYYISLIVFSGKPFVYIPFSDDASAVISKIEQMNLGDFPPVEDFLWTALWDALLLWASRFSSVSVKWYTSGVVLLITDWDSNVWSDPHQVVNYFVESEVPLFVLGVGQDNYLMGYDSWNDEVRTEIGVSLLESLASRTKWSFYRILSAQSFDGFLEDFLSYVRGHEYPYVYKEYYSLNIYLVYVSIVLLLFVVVYRTYTLIVLCRSSK